MDGKQINSTLTGTNMAETDKQDLRRVDESENEVNDTRTGNVRDSAYPKRVESLSSESERKEKKCIRRRRDEKNN